MNQDKLTAIVIFDIDGVVRDVTNSYRRAIADTVESFTQGDWRPTMEDIDNLKAEGIWNNDWKVSQELIYRYREAQGKTRGEYPLEYDTIVEFFQTRYRGEHPQLFDGYIAQEPLLLSANYLHNLTNNQIGWGFFSGATRGSAQYILTQRLGIQNPILVAMEDAPGKPDPTGLFNAVAQIETVKNLACPIFYLGDTVADMLTIDRAQKLQPERNWIAIGILPPHVQVSAAKQADYTKKLTAAGAAMVLSNVEQLELRAIAQWTQG